MVKIPSRMRSRIHMVALAATMIVAGAFVWLLMSVDDRRADRRPAAPSSAVSVTAAASSSVIAAASDITAEHAAAAPSGASSHELEHEHKHKHDDAGPDRPENAPSDEESLVMLDEVIGRVRADIAKEEAAGNAARVKQLEVRLQRLTAERAKRVASAGGGGALGGGDGGVEVGP